MTGITRYSAHVAGARGNYRWSVQFGEMDGYVLIYQTKETGIEAVLLSPKQLDALEAFRRAKKPAKRARKSARRAHHGANNE